MIRLPRLQGTNPIVDKDGRPSLTFTRYFQAFAERIERIVTSIADILGITEQLDAAIKRADEAAAAAQIAAENAAEQAAQAAEQAEAAKREAALTGSYIEPDSVVTADPATVFIGAHTRYYNDGTSAPVVGGSGAATGPGAVNYVSYVDADRSGGAVAYVISTTPPTQTGDTHVVGAVTIPDDGMAEGGEGPTRPGAVYPNKRVGFESDI